MPLYFLHHKLKKMNRKTTGAIILYFTLLLLPFIGNAQDISGIVNSKTSTIFFEDFAYNDTHFNGEIHSNIAGSKYTVKLKNGQESLEGVITDKFAKFKLNLSYKGNIISGEIKQSTNDTKDRWDVLFMGKSLNGTVYYNPLKTVSTYELNYGESKIEGTISQHMNKLVYDLRFDAKKLTGSMSYNVSTVKHTYELNTEDLSEDEFLVFFLIESIKLLNEHINDIEEFQEN